MANRKVNLKDIAEATGVSMMTVSRALRGKAGVGRELRERIAAVADEAGYVPNRAAYQLGQQTGTMTVGVVVPHIANTIFPAVLQTIEGVLAANGYRILLCCTYDNPLKEFNDISALLERQADGLIWAPVLMEESLRAAELIHKQKCPLVFLDRKFPGRPADAVLVDDREGARVLGRHLLERGFRDIAYLGPRMESYTARERREGFFEALAEAGVTPRPEWILAIGSDVDAGRNGAQWLLDRPARPRAVCCFNDPLAVGAEIELLARGWAIPGDMAVAGFSGSMESEISRVPITTIHQDAAGLGRVAAELLLSRLINSAVRPAPIERVLKTHLVARASTLG